MKAKIDSVYHKETGISVATLRVGGKTYRGMSIIREEDLDIASSFAGCKFAELKAYANYYKDRIKKLKQEKRGIEKLYIDMENLKEFPEYENTRPIRFMRKRIYLINEEIKNLQYVVDAVPNIIEKRLSLAREIPSMAKTAKEKREYQQTLSRELD